MSSYDGVSNLIKLYILYRGELYYAFCTDILKATLM